MTDEKHWPLQPPFELQYRPFANYVRRESYVYDGDALGALMLVVEFANMFAEHYPQSEKIVARFDDALTSFLSGECRTLDEAFGTVGFHKGRKLNAYRFRYRHSAEIFLKIEALVDPENPSDKIDQDEAFETVAEDYPYGAGVIRDIYQEVKRANKQLTSHLAETAEHAIKSAIDEGKTKNS